ncbi:hypothetical protein SYNPS1DRAFT_29812 [Syncephalis pseudoplumigaleata]|uniref:Chitin-binding type-4 domain-containing protein n=1 Tax=Syncephalis pseudoplumigaleata TaxID=1712513 RepID=A0A4V1J1B0_9FUNG|nr:hypothetical protein SYNPS1DRAFT_29812 [Syncephalis pseudoplumigaleata]|eukprot:RKP24429.1 hypothetical protein SYNPS1DRAFT_29812 [Syncephalis pseudoplumigaleata]
MHLQLDSLMTIVSIATGVLVMGTRSTDAHSWLECTDFRGGQCHGWQRGWDAQHRDQLMAWAIKGASDTKAPACFPGRQNRGPNNPGFPMARALPGQTLVFTYMERNHAVRDKPRPNPGNYSVHWSASTTADTIKTRADLTRANQLGHDVSFDDGGCADIGTEPGRVRRPCWGRLTVPKNAAPGRHQVVWWWKFARTEGHLEYTACFDVEVLKPGEKPGDKLPPNEASRWLGNKPLFNPGYGNDWFDYASQYTYSAKFKADVAAGRVAPKQRVN